MQKCFRLPLGTYRLGIVLLSDDKLSEQMLYNVKLSYYADSDDCVSEEMHNFSFGTCFKYFLLIVFSSNCAWLQTVQYSKGTG